MPQDKPPLDAYEFCLWLKGFLDLSADYSFTVSKKQVELIREKLEEAVTGNSLPRTPPKPEPPPTADE